MSQVQGVVQGIIERKVNNKTLYSIKLDDGTYYGTGDVKPKVAANASISFNAKQNEKGFWNCDPSSITEVTDAASASVTKSSDSFPEKEQSIAYQCSVKSAAEILIAYMGNKSMSLDEVKITWASLAKHGFEEIKTFGKGTPKPAEKTEVKAAPKPKKPPVDVEFHEYEDDLPDFGV